MSDIGCFIKISRQILDWEWYKDEHTKNLFLHCLIKANWKDGYFKGKLIPRGSFVTSISKLSYELDLTEDEIRTALKHLISTKEITKQITNKYTVITINNYDLFQDSPKQNPNQIPTKSQAIPKPFPTIEEYKEGKKERNNNIVSNETIRQTEVRQAVAEWNTLTEYGIKPVSRLSTGTKRYDSLVSRLKQYGLTDVLKAIDNIRHSDFLQGKVDSKRKWVITFDWFVLPNNFPKVLEGQYNNDDNKINDKPKSKSEQQIEKQLKNLEDRQPEDGLLTIEEVEKMIREGDGNG